VVEHLFPAPSPDNSPSIDQIVPGGGYVPGNVRIISWKANRLKSNATIDDLEAILAYMKKGARLAA
jgi:hypothetical protein